MQIRRRRSCVRLPPSKSFAKLILPSATKKLRIPEKFAASFGGELSTDATISVPDGGSWPVGLEKHGQNVWFSGNWQRFAKHYSISYGFVTEFYYDGGSSFRVLIFDVTGTEISYPPFPTTTAVEGGPSQPHCQRSCVPLSSSKRFYKLILPSAIHAKQLRIPEKFAASFGEELLAAATISVPNGDSWLMGLKKRGKDVWFSYNWKKFAEHYSLSYGCILIFDYEGDSRFRVRIYDITATGISYPPCPTITAIEGVPSLRKKRSRRVEYDDDEYHNQEASCETRGKKQRHRGQQNEIQPEIIDDADHMNNVINFEGNQDGNDRVSNSSSQRAKGASFEATVRHRTVYIPAGFAKKYLKSKNSVKLVKDCNGEGWEVSCVRNCSNSAVMRIVKGWGEFAREHHVSDGDVCEFEVIETEPVVVLKVQIKAKKKQRDDEYRKSSRGVECDADDEHRHHQEASYETRSKKQCRGLQNQIQAEIIDIADHNNDVTNLPRKNKQRSTSLGRKGKSRSNQNDTGGRVSYSSSQRVNGASFTATIRHRRGPYIPVDFATKYLKVDESIKLTKDCNGEEWDASCFYNSAHSAGMRIGNGWGEFAREIHVSEGDVCEFEVIKEEPVVVLKVQIKTKKTQSEDEYRKSSRGVEGDVDDEHRHHQEASYETRSKKQCRGRQNQIQAEIIGIADHNNNVTNLPRKKKQRSTSTSLGRKGKSRYDQNCTGARVSYSSSQRANDAAFTTKIEHSRGPYIPVGFATKYLKVNESIKLKNCNGEEWDVSCFFHRAKSAGMRIGNGWAEFKRENHVSKGDVCKFEVIKKEPVVVLKVQFKTKAHREDEYRKSSRTVEYDADDEHHPHQEAFYETRSKTQQRRGHHNQVQDEIVDDADHSNNAINLPRKSKQRSTRCNQNGTVRVSKSSSQSAKDASFEETVKHSTVYISADFATKYLKLKDSIKLKDCNGEEWDVSCTPCCSSAGMRMGKGWGEFARENHLSDGDVLKFEVIKTQPVVVFKVQIKTKKTQRKKKQRSTFTSLGRKGKTRSNQNGAGGRVSDSSSERENDASFRATIRPSHGPYIPADFAAKYLKVNESIKLTKDFNGEEWDVSCYLNCSRSAGMRMGTGWTKFARGNHVSKGDDCEFVVIKRKPDVVLNVEVIGADCM